MKVTRRQIQKLLLKTLKEAKITLPGPDSSDKISKEKEFEEYTYMRLLSQKQLFLSAHNMTKTRLANINRSDLITFSNFFESFARPYPGSGESYDNLKEDKANNRYSFKSSGIESDSLANYNAIKGNDPFNAFNIVSRILQTNAIGDLEGPMGNFPNSNGEKVEVAIAAILANLNPGEEYASRLDSASGKDIEHINNPTYFELKFSEDSTGKINDNFSNSPPIVSANNKYFIFLSSDRGYFIHCPILARLLEAGTDVMPEDTDAASNSIMMDRVVEYFINQPNLKEAFLTVSKTYYENNTEDIIINAGKTSEYTKRALKESAQTIGLIDALIEHINSSTLSESMIASLRRLYQIKITSNISGGLSKGKASTTGGKINPAKWSKAGNDFDVIYRNIDQGRIKTSDEINSMLGGSAFFEVLRTLVNNLFTCWGFDQTLGQFVMPAEQQVTAPSGYGGLQSYMRKVGGALAGSDYRAYLKGSSTPAAKSHFVFGLVNMPNIPDSIKRNIIDQLKGTASPSLATILTTIKNDNRAVEESLIEIGRGAQGRNLLLTNIIIPYVTTQLPTQLSPSIAQLANKSYNIASKDSTLTLNQKDIDRVVGKAIAKTIAAFRSNTANIANIVSRIAGDSNEFWTNFDRDNSYDEELFKLVFLKDPNAGYSYDNLNPKVIISLTNPRNNDIAVYINKITESVIDLIANANFTKNMVDRAFQSMLARPKRRSQYDAAVEYQDRLEDISSELNQTFTILDDDDDGAFPDFGDFHLQERKNINANLYKNILKQLLKYTK